MSRPLFPCSHCGRWLRIHDARDHANRFYLPTRSWQSVVDSVHTDPLSLLGWDSALERWGVAPEPPLRPPCQARKRTLVDALAQARSVALAGAMGGPTLALCARPPPPVPLPALPALATQTVKAVATSSRDTGTSGTAPTPLTSVADESAFMQDEDEGERAGEAVDALLDAHALPAAAPPAPPPVAAGEYRAPPLPDRHGFSEEECQPYLDPLADAQDGVVRPDFLPRPELGGKHGKYRHWYRLLLFLRTWSAAFNLSNKSVEALTTLLRLVCGEYFTTSMSHHISSSVLGLHKPDVIEYIACANCHALYAQCARTEAADDGKQHVCKHVQPYSSKPSPCAACVFKEQCAEAKAKAGADAGDEKKDAGDREDKRAPREEKKVAGDGAGRRAAGPASLDRCTRPVFGDAKSKCDQPLLTATKQPRRTYCYRPLSKRLAQLLARPGFEESCELWRRQLHEKPPHVLSDITHGAIWQRFMDVRARAPSSCTPCRNHDPRSCPLEGKHPPAVRPFLSRPYGFGLTLNVDWFQPYDHVVYSVGVIFLTVNNIPRVHRNKRENIVLVGILPGGTEKGLDLNSYMEPLVDELLRMQPAGPGVLIATRQHPGGIPVRAAIVCVLCDMPASRKVSGFSSFSAHMGCSRCRRDALDTVPVPDDDRTQLAAETEAPLALVEERHCERELEDDEDDRHSTVNAAVEVELVMRRAHKRRASKKSESKETKKKKEPQWNRTWRLSKRRSDLTDRRCARRWWKAGNEADRGKFQQATGVKSSILLKLPYFAGARMAVPDVMHCIYMGLAKTTLGWLRGEKNWTTQAAEGKRALAAMQAVLDAMEVPADTCRILHKWATNMADLNAAQWKIFVVCMSSAVFDGRLRVDEQHLWDHLVAAAKILSASYIRVSSDRRTPPEYAVERAQREAKMHKELAAKAHDVRERKAPKPAQEKDLGIRARNWLNDELHKADTDTDDEYHTDPECGGGGGDASDDDVDGKAHDGKARRWHKDMATKLRGTDDIAQLAYHLREFARLWEYLPRTKGYPNLHIAQHLAEVMRDYGPTSAITCFSFERFNKVVGDTNTNNRAIERTFAHAWWQMDQLAALPYLTEEANEWSEAELAFFTTLLGGSGSTMPAASVEAVAPVAAPAAAPAVTIAMQVACDRARAGPVVVHETALISEETAQMYQAPQNEHKARAEVARAAYEAGRAAQQAARRSRLAAADERKRARGRHSDDDDDDKDEASSLSLAPPVSAPAPAVPRLRLSGAEPFVGELVLPAPPAARSRSLYGQAPKKKKAPRPAHELNIEDEKKIMIKKKKKKLVQSDKQLYASLVAYFQRIYNCGFKHSNGAVTPYAPSEPKRPLDNEPAAWTAAWMAARAAAAPTDGEYAHFELSLVCPRSHHLRFFNQSIGTETSRLKKSSWVLVLAGTRICAARCRQFVQPTITLTTKDGTVLPPLVHRLVQLRWFSAYCPDRVPLPHSVGAHGDREGERLWWQNERIDTRLSSFAPVQALVSRFIYSPADAPSLARSRLDGTPRQRARYAHGKRMPVYDLVFRACPLPVAMLL